MEIRTCKSEYRRHSYLTKLLINAPYLYPGLLLDLDSLDVQGQRVARFGVVLDVVVALRVCATAIEAGQAHIQTAFVILNR